jgi:hypothetical protein
MQLFYVSQDLRRDFFTIRDIFLHVLYIEPLIENKNIRLQQVFGTHHPKK